MVLLGYTRKSNGEDLYNNPAALVDAQLQAQPTAPLALQSMIGQHSAKHSAVRVCCTLASGVASR